MKHSRRFLKLVGRARRGVTEVDPDAVKARLDQGETFVLIDVREESEWRAGHIPGAMHLGKGIIERDIDSRVSDTGADIVLYCGGGFRSVLAAEALAKMGYQNVASMSEGFRGWTERGFAVDEGD